MIAYITSIGEPTTELCAWALRRNGFDVQTIYDSKTSLAAKLMQIYNLADDNFVRIDSDVIVNKRFTPAMLSWLPFMNSDCWWWQFITFDMLKLDTTHSISYIKKEAIADLRQNVGKVLHSNRPETEMSRIAAFHAPRRFDTYSGEIMGLHGYKADLAAAKQQKQIRNQLDLYDFEMASRIAQL